MLVIIIKYQKFSDTNVLLILLFEMLCKKWNILLIVEKIFIVFFFFFFLVIMLIIIGNDNDNVNNELALLDWYIWTVSRKNYHYFWQIMKNYSLFEKQKKEKDRKKTNEKNGSEILHIQILLFIWFMHV